MRALMNSENNRNVFCTSITTPTKRSSTLKTKNLYHTPKVLHEASPAAEDQVSHRASTADERPPRDPQMRPLAARFVHSMCISVNDSINTVKGIHCSLFLCISASNLCYIQTNMTKNHLFRVPTQQHTHQHTDILIHQ